MAYPTAPSTSPGPALQEEEDSAQWAQLTERIELPQASQPFAGFGESQELKLERVGCAAEGQVRVVIKFTSTDTVQAAIGAPWTLIKKLSLKANGVSGIIAAGGVLLKSRELVEYRSPPDTLASVVKPNEDLAAAEHTWEFIIQVPIAEDLRELDGIVLAQSEETALGMEIQWATLGEVFSAKSSEVTEISGSVKWAMTLFSIGTMTEGKNSVVILPDLTSLHGLIERSQPLVGDGEQESPLTRAAGDMLRYFVSAYDGKYGQFNPTAWTSFILQYGGNQKPIAYSDVNLLVRRNERDYLGRPDVNGVHWAVIDTQLDDAERDAIRPMALSELKALIGIPSTPEANSNIVSAQENLYPANA
jgi:hypothetical protein